VILIAGQT
jgi:hypothetical protein